MTTQTERACDPAEEAADRRTHDLSGDAAGVVRIRHSALVEFAAAVFTAHGMPADRADTAARALCYGDLSGLTSHGLVNLKRLYLPLLREGRADPKADLQIVTDAGAALLVDAHRALGLWAASEVMDMAVERAARHGIGLVSVRDGTHFGCAGFHAARAVDYGMIGIIASNCGRQRIARPLGGRLPMLGTNPLSVAVPAGEHEPFVLDMSTTAVPTGKVRAAARAGQAIPPGWLVDDDGRPVTDPAEFDRGRAHLQWLGGDPETGGYKGYGLGLVVECLAALVSGAGRGASSEALAGGPSRDDDIGYFVLALAPAVLRPSDDVRRDATDLFGALLGCPPIDPDRPVGYPGRREAREVGRRLREGVPIPASLHAELTEIAAGLGLRPPAREGGSAR